MYIINNEKQHKKLVQIHNNMCLTQKIIMEVEKMAQSRINTQEMRGVSNEVEQLASDYTKQVQALYQAGSDLDKMWDGDANSTFNAQLGQDQARFEALNRVIGQYVQVLRDNANDYDKSEADAVQTLQTNTIRRT
jgi:WXG100 family type VII secretion target